MPLIDLLELKDATLAGFKQHVSLSSALGVATAATATFGLGFTPSQGILAGYLTAVGGMVPDLDSEPGRPVRELSSLTAAIVPLLMLSRLKEWCADFDTALMLAAGMYLVIRFMGGWLLGKFTVHRGMFHSIPALFIAAELVFLCWKSESIEVRLLMGCGLAIGFLSHLILDEIYSVQLNGLMIELNQAAGSAVKFFSSNMLATAFTWVLLAGLSWLSYASVVGLEQPVPSPEEIREALHAVPGIDRI